MNQFLKKFRKIFIWIFPRIVKNFKLIPEDKFLKNLLRIEGGDSK